MTIEDLQQLLAEVRKHLPAALLAVMASQCNEGAQSSW
jgi:hypothetical protein